jgi:hypothetical protein
MTLRAKVATFSIVLLGFAVAETASAQTIGQAITNALNKKSKMLQRQADDQRLKATADRMKESVESKPAKTRKASHGVFPQASPGRYYTAGETNDFAFLKVPTYVLPNGLGLQFSGEFSPSEGVTCSAHCPPGAPRAKQ